jgi:hypothetical protein
MSDSGQTHFKHQHKIGFYYPLKTKGVKRMYKWTAKTGRRPTMKHYKEAANLAYAGSHAHTVVAMALRPNGLTQDEVITLLGHPYRNKLKQLVEGHKVKKITLPSEGRSQRIKLLPR